MGPTQGLLTQGWMVLIMKEPQKGKITSTYQPITCLCTAWELLSVNIFRPRWVRIWLNTQAGSRKGLLMIPEEPNNNYWLTVQSLATFKTRKINQCIVWIDYKKAYDSIPHTWILKCLELYKIDRTLRAFIKNLMGLWKTSLEVNSRPTAQTIIKWGIYQGDALLTLLSALGWTSSVK